MQFKATAVRLNELPDVLIQDVAEALDIHPFMLSRWRKQAMEGLIVTKGVKLDTEKSEAIHGRTFATDDEILPVLRSHIPFYDRSRIHPSLNYVSPAIYEKQFA